MSSESRPRDERQVAGHGVSPHRTVAATTPRRAAAASASVIGTRTRDVSRGAHANSRASRHTAASSSPGEDLARVRRSRCCSAATRVASASRNPPRRSHRVRAARGPALRDRSGRAGPSAMSARPTRGRAASTRMRGVRLCGREHLEGQLREDAERSAAADERLVQQEAGGVLHHLAAAARQPPAPVDDACADQEVACPAVAIAARSVHARRHGAAERGPRRRQRRIERQVLSVLREQALDVRDAGARERRERALLGRVLDDAGERGEVEGGRSRRGPLTALPWCRRRECGAAGVRGRALPARRWTSGCRIMRAR